MQRPSHPPICFLYATPAGPMPFDAEKLADPIPLDRSGALAKPGSEITYNDYMEGIQRFILAHWEHFLEAVSNEGTGAGADLTGIDIIAEKHGSDYHPARLRVHAGGEVRSFVVNVAVTDRGKSRLTQDFRLLQYLRVRHGKDLVPRTYFLGEVPFSGRLSEHGEMTLFCGEWLDDYHEFHLSGEGRNGLTATVLWDMNSGHVVLSESEAAEVYRQAAFILTFYYDTQTFSEIFPWHHASGDFVVSKSDGSARVKLITVRQYASRMVFEEEGPENVIEALLVFFANLTLRMRLDRLDGVGPVLWAGEHCVEATVRGFLDALQAKVADGTCDPVLVQEFLRIGRWLSPTELVQIFQPAVAAYDHDAPDVPVVMDNLADHIFLVYQTLQQLPPALEFG